MWPTLFLELTGKNQPPASGGGKAAATIRVTHGLTYHRAQLQATTAVASSLPGFEHA